MNEKVTLEKERNGLSTVLGDSAFMHSAWTMSSPSSL